MSSLLVYGLMALAVLGALGGISYKIHHAGYEEGKAELQPKLTACQGEVATLGTQIKAQNDAVAALEAASKAKVERASKGLAEATRNAQAARSEAGRLRALAGGQQAASACPAGAAAEQIRKGLAR